MKRIPAMVGAFAVGLVGGAGHAAEAKVFSITNATGTSVMVDPALRTFTSSAPMALPETFMLNTVGDSHTFDALLYYTDETSASEPDDPTAMATIMTFTFATDSGPQNEALGGTTRGAVVFPSPLPGTIPDLYSGLAEFPTPIVFDVEGYTLQLEAADTFYNDDDNAGGIVLGTTTSTSGPAFGDQVPVTVTLLAIPEPTTAAALGGMGLVLSRRRRRG